MITLTLDLKTSATILGTPEEKLLERLQRQEVEGICLDDDWRMSIFVLARLLSTTPDTLLEYLEDDILGQKIAETEEEELLDSSQAQAVYKEYLAEVYTLRGDLAKAAEMDEQAVEAWRRAAARGWISG
jgi:hypothetical protein